MKLLIRNVKNTVIYGLLFCLVSLSLPKNFFHAHHNDHDRHAESSWDSSFSADDDYCFVCDIDFSNYTFLELKAVQFDPKAFVQGKEHVYFFETTNYYDYHQRRGPPALI